MDGKNVWITVLAAALGGTAFYAYRATQEGQPPPSTMTAPATQAPSTVPAAPANAKSEREQNERVQALTDRQKDLESRLNDARQAQAQQQQAQSQQQQAQQQRDAERAKIADLEKQLADVKNELASTTANAAADRAVAEKQLAAADRQVAQATANSRFKRVDFDVPTNANQEVTPGISVNVLRTDPDEQRFSGSVWFAPDNRAIPMRGQSANKSVIFFSRNGGRYELVIKNVRDDSVSGYVLIPTSG